eukprot:1158236-Pelagomonas_calceolata.AAC.7
MLAAPGLDFDAMVDGFRATEHQKQQQQQQLRGAVPGQQGMGHANGIDQEPDGGSREEEEGEDGGSEHGRERGDGGRGQDLVQTSRRVLYVSGEEMEDQQPRFARCLCSAQLLVAFHSTLLYESCSAEPLGEVWQRQLSYVLAISVVLFDGQRYEMR